MILGLIVIVLALPPRFSGMVAIGLSVSLLIHHQIQPRHEKQWSTGTTSGATGSQPDPGSILLPAGALFVGGILAMGMSWQPGEALSLDSTKMAASGLMLLAGSSVLRTDREVRRMQRWLSVVLMVVVIVDAFLFLLDPDFSPPVGNSAAILVCFFAPAALADLRKRDKLLYLLLVALFGWSVFSRFVVGAVVIMAAYHFGRDKYLRLAGVGALALVVFGPGFRGFQFGNFSDQLRLRIWEFSAERITDNSGLLIANGEQKFVDELAAEPFYRSLEVSHSHNLLLHVWNSYGLIVTAMWVGALVLLIRALWGREPSLTGQLIAVVALAQLEAIVTDTRVLLILFFFLGLRWRSITEGHTVVEVAKHTESDGRSWRRTRHQSTTRPNARSTIRV